MRIAPDGEILVRGENVTSGLLPARRRRRRRDASAEQTAAFSDGWFHTGDIGELDANGPAADQGPQEGDDRHAAGAERLPGRRRARARSRSPASRTRRSSACTSTARSASTRCSCSNLAPTSTRSSAARTRRSKITSASGARRSGRATALPRTEGTQKLKRREIQRWAAGEQRGRRRARRCRRHASTTSSRASPPAATLTPETTLDELGPELARSRRADDGARGSVPDDARRERRWRRRRTIGELEALVGSGVPEFRRSAVRPSSAVRSSNVAVEARSPRAARRPSRSRFRPGIDRAPPGSSAASACRRGSCRSGASFMKMKVDGLEHLATHRRARSIFAANHQSHMDTPAIMLRAAAAVALLAGAGHGEGVLHARTSTRSEFSRKRGSRTAELLPGVDEFFNAFPLPQREAGTRQTLRYIGEVAADGYSVLIFPGGQTRRGRRDRRRSGRASGMIGARLDVPVVPVRLEGLDKVLHPQDEMAEARARSGSPLARRCGSPATTIRRWRSRSRTRSEASEAPRTSGLRLKAAGLGRVLGPEP